MRFNRRKWAGAKTLVLILIVQATLYGCGIFVQPPVTDVAGTATYNNQVFQIITSLITVLGTLVGFIGLWIKSNIDKRDLAHKTEMAAKELSMASIERNAKVIEEVKEAKVMNASALVAANSHNEKILALQEQVMAQTKRAPARAGDAGGTPLKANTVEVTAETANVIARNPGDSPSLPNSNSQR